MSSKKSYPGFQMKNTSIEINHVSKSYEISRGPKAKYGMLRDQITSAVKAPFQVIQNLFSNSEKNNGRESKTETIWALDDISLKIEEGEVIGIIGPNGAGKSTLLKILTRITEPTRGSIDLYGRVGSLLEVGTGFHKELTGRENVYLNGAILGMRRQEIDQKFDEIVSFAEVEKFINTPVKFYSSGMSVRLAFAVAAHLEPEVLLVDEVLAVGDAAFQKKCLAKMQDVGKRGRTVLFVSHHMPSITRLCERVVLLESGRIIRDGPAHEVVGEYLSTNLGAAAKREWPNNDTAPGNDVVKLRSFRIKNREGETTYTHDIRSPIGIEMEFEVLDGSYALFPLISLHNEEGLWLFSSIDNDPEWLRKERKPGIYRSTGWIPGNLLSEGTLMVDASIRTEAPHQVHFYVQDAIAFQIVDSPDGDAARVDFPGKFPGVVRPMLKWETRYQNNKR